MMGSAPFPLGEGRRACGDIKIQTRKPGTMAGNGAEERVLGISFCLSEST